MCSQRKACHVILTRKTFKYLPDNDATITLYVGLRSCYCYATSIYQFEAVGVEINNAVIVGYLAGLL